MVIGTALIRLLVVGTRLDSRSEISRTLMVVLDNYHLTYYTKYCLVNA